MANRKIWVIFFISLILITGFVHWQRISSVNAEIPNRSISTNSSASDVQQSKPSTIEKSAGVTHVDALDIPETNTPNENDIILTDQDLQDIGDWYEDSVYHRDYAAYDEASLLTLADAGDVMAMKTLVLKYLEPGRYNEIENTDALIEHARKTDTMVDKAILYGDRELLGMIPGSGDARRVFTSPNSTPEEKHQGMIDALAYAEFIGLRGHLGKKYEEQILFFDIYKDRGAPDTLTEQEKQAIRQRAREIYDAYEQKRIELGLGPFDNSVSEGKAKEFEIEKQKYLEKMGDKAI